MDNEHFQRKNKIKLRVVTSTGLNLLCTANTAQKVRELLPHIIKLYQEVKEDQGLVANAHKNTQPTIKFLKKEQFYVAPSEMVGDIFDDNDEVFCEIADNNFSVKNNLKIPKIDVIKTHKQQSRQKIETEPLLKT